ncbi:MAG: hypothetical protein RBT19_15440 [Tenuifilaceae bacterium]|nr:hypothetical protein [Tenuifilaceae bacterium]
MILPTSYLNVFNPDWFFFQHSRGEYPLSKDSPREYLLVSQYLNPDCFFWGFSCLEAYEKYIGMSALLTTHI